MTVTPASENNPARDLVNAFKTHTVKHMADELTPPAKAGELMRAMASLQGKLTTEVALLSSALLFQRPGKIRSLESAWIDLDGAIITIPSEAMKRAEAGKLNGRPHVVPLATQAVGALREMQPLTGHDRYVFQSLRTRNKPMGENTVNAALRGLGCSKDEMTAHGIRAMARTIMVDNIAGIDADVIEAQLTYGKSGPLRTAYNCAEYMTKRKSLMRT